jgi:hypothetical protein
MRHASLVVKPPTVRTPAPATAPATGESGRGDAERVAHAATRTAPAPGGLRTWEYAPAPETAKGDSVSHRQRMGGCAGSAVRVWPHSQAATTAWTCLPRIEMTGTRDRRRGFTSSSTCSSERSASARTEARSPHTEGTVPTQGLCLIEHPEQVLGRSPRR